MRAPSNKNSAYVPLHVDPVIDTIEEITEGNAQFYGIEGKMLRPSIASVAAVVAQVPTGRIITIDSLRRELARKFEVQVTSLAAVKKALVLIAQDPTSDVPYWRVIKGDGELSPSLPGGVEAHAARLIEEGFSIETRGKLPKVKDFRDHLMLFENEFRRYPDQD